MFIIKIPFLVCIYTIRGLSISSSPDGPFYFPIKFNLVLFGTEALLYMLFSLGFRFRKTHFRYEYSLVASFLLISKSTKSTLSGPQFTEQLAAPFLASQTVWRLPLQPNYPGKQNTASDSIKM